jgi:hypothetical protein
MLSVVMLSVVMLCVVILSALYVVLFCKAICSYKHPSLLIDGLILVYYVN